MPLSRGTVALLWCSRPASPALPLQATLSEKEAQLQKLKEGHQSFVASFLGIESCLELVKACQKQLVDPLQLS